MLERQEEEFQEAFDGSEVGHGVAWDEEENVAREEQERTQPPTKLQTLDRMTKRLGQKMMEIMGWTPGTAFGSKVGPASSPVQANTWGLERPPRAGIGTEPWNLVSPMSDRMWDVVLRKIRRTDAVPLGNGEIPELLG